MGTLRAQSWGTAARNLPRFLLVFSLLPDFRGFPGDWFDLPQSSSLPAPMAWTEVPISVQKPEAACEFSGVELGGTHDTGQDCGGHVKIDLGLAQPLNS